MVLSSRSKVVITVALAFALLGGCSDYLNNWDTVTFRAGNANQANTAIQQISPWPKNLTNTRIEHGG